MIIKKCVCLLNYSFSKIALSLLTIDKTTRIGTLLIKGPVTFTEAESCQIHAIVMYKPRLIFNIMNINEK